MERYLKIEEAANKSESLKDIILAIQNAETRIKEVIFNSFLVYNKTVEALVIRIVDETLEKLPEEISGVKVDKEQFRQDLMANAHHWMTIVKYTNEVIEQRVPKIISVANEAYHQVAVMFEKGQPRHENYHNRVLRLTKALAKEMASKSFKTSTVNFKGLEMRTNISIRGAVERQVRDAIHQSEIKDIISTNRFIWISSHADCSERCEPWQGQLYSTDGSSGEIEGYKYIPLEIATNANWVTTRLGKRWNNSVLVGFNCRHYTIPFMPGTVPVIEYDPKIIARERKITETMRRMERDIIKEKTLHRLYIEAERRNEMRLPKHHINMLKEHIRENYRIKEAYYQKFCEKNGRAFYPWRTQIILSKSDASRIVDEKVKIIDRKYAEIYNDNGKTFSATVFLNKKKFDKHVAKHLSDFPKMKQDNYERYARTFLSQKVDGKRILGFTNKNSFVFRYDREKNIFATAKPNGAIETFYKPKDGLLYWEEQMDIHGEPNN